MTTLVKQNKLRPFDLLGHSLQEFGLNRISIAMHNESRAGDGFQLGVDIEAGLEQGLVKKVAHLDEGLSRLGRKIQRDVFGSIRVEAVGPEAESKGRGNSLRVACEVLGG